MQYIKRWLIVTLLFLVVLPLAACGGSAEPEDEEPAYLEPFEGTDFNLVTLTERAAERLGIQSEEVAEEETGDGMKMVVPYSAVIYDLNGNTFAYLRNPGEGSLKFVRTPITVERIEGGQAILSAGPPLGSHIVTVGVAELYGADTGVGK